MPRYYLSFKDTGERIQVHALRNAALHDCGTVFTADRRSMGQWVSTDQLYQIKDGVVYRVVKDAQNIRTMYKLFDDQLSKIVEGYAPFPEFEYDAQVLADWYYGVCDWYQSGDHPTDSETLKDIQPIEMSIMECTGNYSRVASHGREKNTKSLIPV